MAENNSLQNWDLSECCCWFPFQASPMTDTDLSVQVQIKEAGLTLLSTLYFYKYVAVTSVSITVMPNAFKKEQFFFIH